MFSDVESSTWASFILSDLFIMTVVVPLSAFFRFITVLFLSSATAFISLRDRFIFRLSCFYFGEL